MEEIESEEAPGPSTSTEERKIESEVAPEEPSPLMKLLSSVKDIQHRHAHFSQSAIDSLLHELWGEDNEIDNIKSKRSSIYMLVAINSWLRIDAAEDDDDGESLTPKLSVSCIDSTMRHPDSKFPPKLLNYFNYGCTMWGSRVIIAGGTYEPEIHYLDDDVKPSKEVHAYDTIAEKWDQLPRMVARRGYHPVLVATEDMIFVFGGNPQHKGIYVEDKETRANNLIKFWAEYYDTKAKQPSWRCFPELPPTELLEYSPWCSYAVYPKGSLILFYIVDCSRVVSFDYSSWVWKIYNAEDHPIAKGPVWSASVVVIDHFLFWHDEKTIYGYDLSMSKGVILPVYSFDFTSRFCYPARNFHNINFEPRCSFLVRSGKDELCLFWLEKTNTIRYFTFRIYICEPAAALELVLGQTGLLESPVNDIGFAFGLKYKFAEVETRVASNDPRSESNFGNVIKKNGQISFDNREDYSLKAMHERVTSSTQLNCYWGNMLRFSGERCLVEPIACIEGDNLVTAEHYGCTLRNSLTTLLENDGAKWWVSTNNGFKMGPFMQHVFKEIIGGLVTFAKKRIKYEPTLDSVVLDCERDSPKVMFRSAVETTIETRDNFYPEIIWQALDKLVGYVIDETVRVYSHHPMHPEVKHIRAMLLEDCKAADCMRMIEHPALLTDREVLDFIMRFMDESREGKVIVEKVKTGTSSFGEWQAGVGDWEQIIEKSDRMAAVLRHWKDDIAKNTDLETSKDVVKTQPVRLAYFIRNMYQHLNSPQNLRICSRYDYDQLPKYVDDNFPKLATYLFKCYVKWEGLFVS